jgi:hypothetical protein
MIVAECDIPPVPHNVHEAPLVTEHGLRIEDENKSDKAESRTQTKNKSKHSPVGKNVKKKKENVDAR